jgi:hypothetical protein
MRHLDPRPGLLQPPPFGAFHLSVYPLEENSKGISYIVLGIILLYIFLSIYNYTYTINKSPLITCQEKTHVSDIFNIHYLALARLPTEKYGSFPLARTELCALAVWV